MLRWAVGLPLATGLLALLASWAIDGWATDLLPSWDVASIPDLSGKVAIVTGPTLHGIGYETALALAGKGAHVVLAGRSARKGREALEALRKELPKASAEFRELDLGSLANVQRFCRDFLRDRSELHILVNNAGVAMNKFGLSADGIESQFATNHLGHFLLTKLLLPALERGAPARVVTVSSIAAEMPSWAALATGFLPAALLPSGASPDLNFTRHLYDKDLYHPALAYGRSKLANILFARALDRRLAGKAVYSNAAHPGGVKTNVAHHIVDDRLAFLGQLPDLVMEALLLQPKRGAVTQLYLAASPEVESKEIRGQFFLPQARPGRLPGFVSEAAEEELWRLSEELVKGHLLPQ